MCSQTWTVKGNKDSKYFAFHCDESIVNGNETADQIKGIKRM